MIIVVEGVSAAGKTTWCRTHAAHCLVPESFPPDRHLQPAEGHGVAQYWTDWNAKRWRDALAIEARLGCAVCDTDPQKLHYQWCLMQIGEAPAKQWEMQLASTRRAFEMNKLGFADLYLLKPIDPALARAQMLGDAARQRGRFELHLRLQEPLIAWYRAIEAVFPGRVAWQLPDSLPVSRSVPMDDRYSLTKFDRFIASLPRR